MIIIIVDKERIAYIVKKLDIIQELMINATSKEQKDLYKDYHQHWTDEMKKIANGLPEVKEEEPKMEKELQQIAEAWKETKEHFGDEFPFEDDLQVIIKEKGDIKDEPETENTDNGPISEG